MTDVAGNILNKIIGGHKKGGLPHVGKILGDHDSNDSAYTRHVQIEMKKGKSMKEAAASWRAKKK